MALTNTQIKNAKPKDKQYKLSDQGGLSLIVRPTGSKAWKYDYRLDGKRLTHTIGTYPETSLAEAREAHTAARRLVQTGTNPTSAKNQGANSSILFSTRCKAWLSKQNLAESTRKDLVQRIEKNLYPYMDSKCLTNYTTKDLFKIMEKMTNRGTRETAFRMAGILRKVFNEALILDDIEANPANGLTDLMPAPDSKTKSNFGHITNIDDFKILLQQIHKPDPTRDKAVTLALKLMPLAFLRPKNIRFMKWAYIDFDAALMTIPKEAMKMGKELKVPLANQALAILNEAHKDTGELEYVFMSTIGIGKNKPIGESATTNAIRRMIDPRTGKSFGTGFMTSHGFRHTASTMLNELGYRSDVIELQLAHESNDRVRATYNKAQLMTERTKMMQEWAGHLDALKVNPSVQSNSSIPDTAF
jgi:integrase